MFLPQETDSVICSTEIINDDSSGFCDGVTRIPFLLIRSAWRRHHLQPSTRALCDIRVIPLWILAIIPIIRVKYSLIIVRCIIFNIRQYERIWINRFIVKIHYTTGYPPPAVYPSVSCMPPVSAAPNLTIVFIPMVIVMASKMIDVAFIVSCTITSAIWNSCRLMAINSRSLRRSRIR